MAERNDMDHLSAVLKAASDANRRAILTLLAQEGPMRVTDIAHHFDISLNSVSKHIKVLEACGLATRRTEWREHLIEVQMGPLSDIDQWFAELRSIWALRLDALEAALKEDDND
ncbi:metalloregulator ArsR/SmtB family transcription factor [Aliiroseovarius sp. S2029]|nr:metalloregulator ArsR/SmtB family transcription factor [Aliiroseovarius sp. S2029]